MSQIGVVQYTSTSPHKVNILQQSTTTNNNTKTNSDRQIIFVRKPQSIVPQPKDFSRDDILLTNTARKGSKKSTTTTETKSNPQPIAVARRNARERNRVKQVNNGFANLRQHIPNFIAQAFESNNGRGGNKKLSKVETLRMAVEYIRSLEEVLALDGVHCKQENVPSNMSYPSPSSSNASPTDQNNSKSSSVSYNFAMSPSEDDDDLSSVSTPPPQQQYIRINTANNTFEIIPSTLYENTENLDPMSVDSNLLSDAATLMDTHSLQFDVDNQDLSYLNINSMQTTGSLSPGMYSEGSLSPNLEKCTPEGQNCFIQVFNTAHRLNSNFNVQIKTEINELPVISVKTENELPETQKGLVDVMNWWETQAQTTAGS